MSGRPLINSHVRILSDSHFHIAATPFREQAPRQPRPRPCWPRCFRVGCHLERDGTSARSQGRSASRARRSQTGERRHDAGGRLEERGSPGPRRCGAAPPPPLPPLPPCPGATPCRPSSGPPGTRERARRRGAPLRLAGDSDRTRMKRMERKARGRIQRGARASPPSCARLGAGRRRTGRLRARAAPIANPLSVDSQNRLLSAW